MKQPRILCALCYLVLALFPEAGHGQSTLIPLTTARGFVFDYAGNYLYIATSDGFVDPYNLSTGTIEPPFNLGGSLNGIDIARDDSFLLVAQNNTGVSQGVFHKFDLTTEVVTNIGYTKAFGESGAWDVDIASNGLALVTTQYSGSGWTPLRQIVLSTNAISTRSDAPGSGSGGMVRQNTQIHHSADGSRLYLLESNISSGPLFTYSATSNTFGPTAQTNTFLDSASAALNRTGALLGTRIGTSASLDTAPNFGFVHSFSGLDSGIAFDGVRDIFYGVNSTLDQIIAYDTNTFAEKYRLNIGENVNAGAAQFGQGTLVASPDGNYLALRTGGGVRLITIPELAAVVSRKIHNVTPFDLLLPLTGQPSVEPRSRGATGEHTLVFIFTYPLASVESVTLTGCGLVQSSGIGADPYQYIVNLTGVCDAQYLTVTLNNVVSVFNHTGTFAATMGLLVGDTNNDAAVNSADISQVKSQSGITLGSTNFRTDLNLDGTINSADISFVKSRSGTAITAPPPARGDPLTKRERGHSDELRQRPQ